MLRQTTLTAFAKSSTRDLVRRLTPTTLDVEKEVPEDVAESVIAKGDGAKKRAAWTEAELEEAGQLGLTEGATQVLSQHMALLHLFKNRALKRTTRGIASRCQKRRFCVQRQI